MKHIHLLVLFLFLSRREGQAKGAQIGHPVQGVRVTLTDGQTHGK